MKKAVFALEPLSCPSCIKKIETALNRTEGVMEAKVLFHSNKVRIQFHEDRVGVDQLQTIITNLGYPVLSAKTS